MLFVYISHVCYASCMLMCCIRLDLKLCEAADVSVVYVY